MHPKNNLILQCVKIGAVLLQQTFIVIIALIYLIAGTKSLTVPWGKRENYSCYNTASVASSGRLYHFQYFTNISVCSLFGYQCQAFCLHGKITISKFLSEDKNRVSGSRLTSVVHTADICSTKATLECKQIVPIVFKE